MQKMRIILMSNSPMNLEAQLNLIYDIQNKALMLFRTS